MSGELTDTALAEADGGLLASFPNLKGLEPLDTPEKEWANVDLPLLNDLVTTGKLNNGLTYFVQENREPKQRAELFLIVGFGSIVEEENERGIAHIIEHLGFSATKSYENHAIVKFLESIGAPFGACQNAYTSFDRTVYTLHVPTDKEGIVKEALTVLREFAYFTRISGEDLDKERKVVLEEWRESRNAQGRLFESYITALCKGSKWCERLPIGTEEVIRGVPAETLRAFYAKYYHPARMAVVAVGDFDGKDILATVKELFDIAPADIEPLPRAPTAPERPRHAVPDTDGIAVASSTDRELSFAQGMIDCKRPKQGLRNIAAFKRRLTEDLFHKTLSSRLLKLMLEPKGTRNYFMVATETGEPIPPLNNMSITIAPLPGRMRPALQAIVREIERVRRLGFHEAEVVRAKRSMLAEYEEEYIERENRPSDSYAEEFTSFFLDDQPCPGITKRAQLAAAVLPSIESKEVSDVAAQYCFEKNVVVKIATPPLSLWNPLYTSWSLLQACWNFMLPRPSLDLPSNIDVAAIFQSISGEKLDPWPADADDVDNRIQHQFDLVASKRISVNGTVGVPSAVREIFAQGVPRPLKGATDLLTKVPLPADCGLGEEIVLRNGLRIFFKNTDLFDDEIVVRARRWGGLSEHQSSGFLANGTVSTEAQVCSMAAMMLGICGLSVESLQECLDGKRVEPNPPGMEAYSTCLDSGASPADFELLLMLLHLLFMTPVEPGAKSWGRLNLVKLGLLAWRLGENRDPGSQFRKRVQRVLTGNHPYTRLPSLWSILNLNFKKASAVFNERVSMPCEWTFVLVGRLPPKDVLLPLLDKYMGTIPNVRGGQMQPPIRCEDEVAIRQAVTPLEVNFPPKAVREEVKLNMIDPKGSTVLVHPFTLAACTTAGSMKSAEAELRELFRLRILVRLLETRLIEVLRFKRGQVYGVSVGDDLSLSPPHLGVPRKGTITIGFECDPEESDELIEASKAELDQLRDGSAAFTAENVHAALEQERRLFEEQIKKNDWWCNTVLDLYFSRCHAVTGQIGETVALWWRVRAEVVGSFDVNGAMEALKTVLPVGAHSVVVTMRPKGGKNQAKSKTA